MSSPQNVSYKPQAASDASGQFSRRHSNPEGYTTKPNSGRGRIVLVQRGGGGEAGRATASSLSHNVVAASAAASSSSTFSPHGASPASSTESRPSSALLSAPSAAPGQPQHPLPRILVRENYSVVIPRSSRTTLVMIPRIPVSYKLTSQERTSLYESLTEDGRTSLMMCVVNIWNVAHKLSHAEGRQFEFFKDDDPHCMRIADTRIDKRPILEFLRAMPVEELDAFKRFLVAQIGRTHTST